MRPTVLPLENTVQNYGWGSTTAIANFLGRPSPRGLPEAELWVGAHPKAPSRVAGQANAPALDALIREHPVTMLGEKVAARYGALPYLLKILAAAEPLSIQCHPDAAQARAGFARENQAGLALDDPRRNYRDPNHKPELLVALTPFLALKGFRPPEEILENFEPLSAEPLREPLAALAQTRSADALKQLFGALLSLRERERLQLLAAALDQATGQNDVAWQWVSRLHQRYPGDVGALSPLLLNLLTLAPEEALFLGAGELHAHLEGTGIEIMASSDNVLRGGLTSKHVDVDELLATATFASGPATPLRPEATAAGVHTYRTPAPEFELSLIDIAPEAVHASPQGRTVELLLGIEGRASIVTDDGALPLDRGHAAFVPAALPSYRLEGEGRVCRATVGVGSGLEL